MEMNDGRTERESRDRLFCRAKAARSLDPPAVDIIAVVIYEVDWFYKRKRDLSRIFYMFVLTESIIHTSCQCTSFSAVRSLYRV